eukprot:TRINITY_DN13928_c0_g1_i4.p1 TRINITY_DN13928_c0_g1~~TRINITY_DN13928_c0_g1_i4.p1  ORF type:complete len:141 (+),score=31.23 TRINITY_DN13928_c0_g1_i4:73-495(+)
MQRGLVGSEMCIRDRFRVDIQNSYTKRESLEFINLCQRETSAVIFVIDKSSSDSARVVKRNLELLKLCFLDGTFFVPPCVIIGVNSAHEKMAADPQSEIRAYLKRLFEGTEFHGQYFDLASKDDSTLLAALDCLLGQFPY